MKTIIRTAYDNSYVDPGINFIDRETGEPEKSLTDQSQADDCDINLLMARYEKSGVITVSDKTPVYADVTDLKSFQEAQNIFIQASSAFASLPAKVRKEFDNDPAKYLDFMDNLEENKSEAIRLGLLPEATAAVDPTLDDKNEA